MSICFQRNSFHFFIIVIASLLKPDASVTASSLKSHRVCSHWYTRRINGMEGARTGSACVAFHFLTCRGQPVSERRCLTCPTSLDGSWSVSSPLASRILAWQWALGVIIWGLVVGTLFAYSDTALSTVALPHPLSCYFWMSSLHQPTSQETPFWAFWRPVVVTTGEYLELAQSCATFQFRKGIFYWLTVSVIFLDRVTVRVTESNGTHPEFPDKNEPPFGQDMLHTASHDFTNLAHKVLKKLR